MKAPDKIYIAESLIKKPYGNEWSPTEYVSRENTEYIRKDALVEFLRKEISCLPPLSESGFEKSLAIHNAIIHGQCTTMQIVLKKIESL